MNTPAKPENPLPPNEGSAMPSTHDALKEYITAALSIAIVGFTLYVMWQMFGGGSEIAEGKWKQQSTILQLAIALAGTVTGYYYGRIPAERAASAAQQSAAKSNALAEMAAANESRIRNQVADLRRQVATPTGAAIATDASTVRRQVEERLDDILNT